MDGWGGVEGNEVLQIDELGIMRLYKWRDCTAAVVIHGLSISPSATKNEMEAGCASRNAMRR